MIPKWRIFRLVIFIILGIAIFIWLWNYDGSMSNHHPKPAKPQQVLTQTDSSSKFVVQLTALPSAHVDGLSIATANVIRESLYASSPIRHVLQFHAKRGYFEKSTYGPKSHTMKYTFYDPIMITSNYVAPATAGYDTITVGIVGTSNTTLKYRFKIHPQ